jgi:hypothetical protein
MDTLFPSKLVMVFFFYFKTLRLKNLASSESITRYITTPPVTYYRGSWSEAPDYYEATRDDVYVIFYSLFEHKPKKKVFSLFSYFNVRSSTNYYVTWMLLLLLLYVGSLLVLIPI